MKINTIKGEVGEAIHLSVGDDKVRDIVANGGIVVVKNNFNSKALAKCVNESCNQMRKIEPKYRPVSQATESHWRIDDSPKGSDLPKKQALYFFACDDHTYSPIRRYGELIGGLRNRLAGLVGEDGLSFKDTHFSVTVLQHYPRGGGFMDRHQDPADPQKIVVTLLAKSQFSSGGLKIEDESGQVVDLESEAEQGDILIHRPDLFHWIDPIDPNHHEIDFYEMAGRFRIANLLLPHPE